MKMLLFGKNENYDILNKLKKDPEDSISLSGLVSVASEYSFSGNLWHTFISWLIINDENPYTLACERKTPDDDTLCRIAEEDFEDIYALFFNAFPSGSLLNTDFCKSEKKGSNYSHIGKLASNLSKKLEGAKDPYEFKSYCDEFFKNFGVGNIGLGKGFSVHTDDGFEISPIEYYDPVKFSDLWGYEIQKNELIQNTRLFISGEEANNVLLYGDSGTGKSTAIKALLNEFYSQGLRVIEVYKHQFSHIPKIINQIKNRDYRFVLFMDDLSFEEFEIEYKYLKSLIEGSLEPKPDNILVYATSNRRHLIKEHHSDRAEGNDRHSHDTVQEKLSLSDRFGVSIYFPKPISAEYKEIVLHLAKLNNISIPEDELLRKAHIWGMEHGKLSGRVAAQFIKSLG